MARGEAPLPVTIGKISKGWVEDELDEWVRGRIAERDGVAAKLTASKARAPRKPRRLAADTGSEAAP